MDSFDGSSRASVAVASARPSRRAHGVPRAARDRRGRRGHFAARSRRAASRAIASACAAVAGARASVVAGIVREISNGEISNGRDPAV